MDYYKSKKIDYHTGTRMDVIALLPKSPQQKILEIGAGGGDTLTFIKKNNLAAEVMGVELFKLDGTNQSNPVIDKFIIGNIEDEEIQIEKEYFDVIILADVLEHLLDPWAIVEKVDKYLKKEGKIIVSLPNIREINTLIKIVILGDFRYKGEGVLDKTHFRFFCKKNMLEMLNTDNLKTVYVSPAFKFREDRKSRKLYNKLTFGLIEGFLAFQYLFIVERKS